MSIRELFRRLFAKSKTAARSYQMKTRPYTVSVVGQKLVIVNTESKNPLHKKQYWENADRNCIVDFRSSSSKAEAVKTSPFIPFP